MDNLAPSTVNLRLSAVRKLIEEARRNGMLTSQAAAQLADVPNLSQRGTRLRNWLTRENMPRSVLPEPSGFEGRFGVPETTSHLV